MALFTIKPNRGTVLFFFALGFALCGRSGLRKHEQQLFVRDAPVSHSARRLLRCVAGHDAERYLWPRPTDENPAPWSDKLNLRLRRMVANQPRENWLGQCVPIARRLASRLTLAEQSRANTFANYLEEASRNNLRALELIEPGTLGTALAQLTFEATRVSSGAEEAWTSPLAAAPSDLPLPTEPSPAKTLILPTVTEYAMLALPDLVLFQDTGERRLWRALVNTQTNQQSSIAAIGHGAPLRAQGRNGFAVVSNDVEDQLFVASGEPQALIALPPAIRSGAQGMGEWQAVHAGNTLYLFTEEHGHPHLWTTPREGVLHWEEVQAAAWREMIVYGSTLAPSPDGSGVRLLLARAGTHGVQIEAWTHNPTAGLQALPLRPAVLGTEGRGPLSPIPVFAPRVATCVSGDTHHLLIAGEGNAWAIRWRNQQLSRTVLGSSEQGGLQPGSFDFSCNTQGSLLFATVSGVTGPYYFDAARSGATAIITPRPGAVPRAAGAVLLPDGILTVVQTQHTLRAYYTTDEGRNWNGGTLLAEGRPASNNNSTLQQDIPRMELMALTADGNNVAALLQSQHAGQSFVSRVGSRDGGRTWIR